MLSPEQRARWRRDWLKRIDAEIACRQAERDAARPGSAAEAEAAVARLIAELDQMGERLRAAPDYRPPTPAESAAAMRELDALLAQHGRSS